MVAKAKTSNRTPNRIENNNLLGFEPLITPREVKAQLPITPEIERLVLSTRRAIRDVLRGIDDRRLVVIVGPCSIHDAEAAYDYATRLRRVADEVEDCTLVLMRTYFEKPRTTIGWVVIRPGSLSPQTSLTGSVSGPEAALLRPRPFPNVVQPVTGEDPFEPDAPTARASANATTPRPRPTALWRRRRVTGRWVYAQPFAPSSLAAVLLRMLKFCCSLSAWLNLWESPSLAASAAF